MPPPTLIGPALPRDVAREFTFPSELEGRNTFRLSLALAHPMKVWTGSPSAADAMDTFSKLPATDLLRVRFESQGCFSSSNHEFTFHPGEPAALEAASVEQVRSIDLFPLPIGEARKELGQLVLTDSEVKGLDALFDFYRSEMPGGCTTVSCITISQFRDGAVLATEHFVDETGRTEGMKGVTTFPEVVRRLEEQNRKAWLRSRRKPENP